MSMEYDNLPDDQAKTMLRSSTPIGDVFRKYENFESDHMDIIHSVIEYCAREAVKENTRTKDESR